MLTPPLHGVWLEALPSLIPLLILAYLVGNYSEDVLSSSVCLAPCTCTPWPGHQRSPVHSVVGSN